MPNTQSSFRSLGLAALVASALPGVALAQTPNTGPSGDTPFSSMAIARDDADDCRVPKPPADLAETAYLRNGYRAILRILIAEEALSSETCTCLLDQFTWRLMPCPGSGPRATRACPSRCSISTPRPMRWKPRLRRPVRSKWGSFATFWDRSTRR